MTKGQGWVKLHRAITDNDLWLLEPFTKGQAWIDLFLNANHKDAKIEIRGNVIDIKRGQLGWSELTMAKRWTWSKNKVRRFLKYLETEQQIEQQKDRFITTIITILNYEKYQNDTADDTAERQQKDSRRYINKNEENVKNEKKDIAPSLSEDSNKPIKGKEYRTLKQFEVDHKEILELAKQKYPKKDSVKCMQEFVIYCKTKTHKYKNLKLAYYNWLREDRYGKYAIK